jgi:hypothetical protein
MDADAVDHGGDTTDEVGADASPKLLNAAGLVQARTKQAGTCADVTPATPDHADR